jgi:hypothetical protein
LISGSNQKRTNGQIIGTWERYNKNKMGIL